MAEKFPSASVRSRDREHFWLGIVITTWGLYGIGLGLLSRQIKQEAAARRQTKGAHADADAVGLI
ncbi:hypothetical protein GGX14DRAFT_567991 [Mycena pura]|uniref:Uncharacterized protein n=1 Tax=Mycena pura TaxID=153505 RepID=A0AAD6VAB7_9AGAR|nr:hypothetical protein GGX14DRAFT_567991 [Mycena pura]